jgi:hypothetical protein
MTYDIEVDVGGMWEVCGRCVGGVWEGRSEKDGKWGSGSVLTTLYYFLLSTPLYYFLLSTHPCALSKSLFLRCRNSA